MSICRAWLRSTYNALTLRMYSEQIRLQVSPKLFGPRTSGSRSEFQTLGPATENARFPKVLQQTRGTDSWWFLAKKSTSVGFLDCDNGSDIHKKEAEEKSEANDRCSGSCTTWWNVCTGRIQNVCCSMLYADPASEGLEGKIRIMSQTTKEALFDSVVKPITSSGDWRLNLYSLI